VDTYRIYRNSISALTNISSVIYELNPFSYRINPDFTFELPELTFKSTMELDAGDKIIIVEVADNSRQITFYVEKVKYDYTRQLYEYTCPHILQSLDKILARSLPTSFPNSTWCDITPGYSEFNYQMGAWATQGTNVWSRSYWQITFLMKMMIRKITGLGIASISSSAIDSVESPYTTRAQNEFEQWADMAWAYKDLALNIPMTQHLGAEKTQDHNSTEFMTWQALPTCLDLLRWLCSALCITIDIFNSDYRMAVGTISTLPADADLQHYETDDLDLYRGYTVATRRFETGSAFFKFGTWNEYGDYHAYVFGEEPEERAIETFQGLSENTNETTRKLALSYPNFFQIVGRYVNESSGYQSASMVIWNGEDDYGDEQMNSDAWQTWWDGLTKREKCEIALPGLYMKMPYVEIDLATLKMRMEVLS